MMKTQQELQLHYWGPHYEMVKEYNAKHGTDIQPWESVRFWDSKSCGFLGNPLFNDRLGHYDFALTILYDDKRKEHRPVFVGDTVYDKLIAIKLKVIDYDTLQCDDLKFTNLNWDKLSWNQPAPKRTFNIGDKKLPCPKKNGLHTFDISARSPNCNPAFESFHFNSAEELADFYNGVRDILTAARDKE